MADIFELFARINKEQTPREPVSFVVAGLGNPGAEYASTRHNTGFLALDYISGKLGAQVNRAKYNALCGETEICGKRVLLLKPQTYMNESGQALRAAADFYKIAPEHIIIISDDISLPVGQLRVRRSGSDGGQKGLRSIIAQLGTDAFPRIRVGIGEKPTHDYELADWVLSKFSQSELKLLDEKFGTLYEGLEKIISGDIDGAMTLCNRK